MPLKGMAKSLSNRAPLIAVTTSELRPSHRARLTPEGEPEQEEMTLGLKYLKAIGDAGAIPMVIPPLRRGSLEPLLDQVAGVCLSGGPDLDPAAYADRRHALLGPTWRALDDFELAITRAADQRHLPILAICRGVQVLNVARGGTLHQHLPDAVGERVRHRQQEPGHQPTHWVTLSAISRLAQILRCRRTKVNSFHHQGVAVLGRGLAVTSRAADRSIESVEALDRDFTLGVQWHAECLVSRARHAALFTAFVEAAQRFQAGATGLPRAA